MANFGRFACVALPFALTLASLIAMLIAGLAGVTDKNLYMFQVNTTDLSLSTSMITNLIGARSAQPFDFHDPTLLAESDDGDSGNGGGSSSSGGKNISGADLGLYDFYDVNLWGYCYKAHHDKGDRECTKAEFNWAQRNLNVTTNNVKGLITASGKNVTLPDEITTAISTFSTIARWTEIVFIIALVALGVELVFGIFATCTRVFSCLTFLVAGIAAVAVCAAAALTTAMSVVIVGAVEGSAKIYGVTASLNKSYLAAVWIGAAFAIAAGLFWLFTICCCAPDHNSRRSSRSKGEKGNVPTGSYQPIYEDPSYPSGGYARHSGPQYGYAGNANAPHRDMAYEPYSHANV